MILTLKEKLDILTREIIIAKADADFDPDLSKHEYVDSLQSQITELLK